MLSEIKSASSTVEVERITLLGRCEMELLNMHTVKLAHERYECRGEAAAVWWRLLG